jgi:hypothetical protein
MISQPVKDALNKDTNKNKSGIPDLHQIWLNKLV